MHYDTIRAVCHRIVINRADAEDATQQALMSIVRALPGFDGRAKFTTWAYRIATNAAIDEVRRIGRRAMPAGDAVLDAVTPPSPDPADGVDDRVDFENALARLRPEHRVVLTLRHIADLDYQEIADTVGLPLGTVKSRLARGRDELIGLLGNQTDGTGRHNGVTHDNRTDQEGSTP